MSAVRPAQTQPNPHYPIPTVVPLVDQYEETPVRIAPYVELVRARWKLLVAGALAGCLAAAVYSYTRVPLYRSSIKLIAVPSGVDPKANGRMAPSEITAYLPFIQNADTLDRAIKAVGLDGPEHRSSVSGLGGLLKTNVSREAPILELLLDFPDPEKGRTLLGAIALETIELNRSMITRSDKESREFLQTQRNQTDTALREQEQYLLTFKERARLEDRRKVLDTVLSERARLQAMITDTQIRISELTSSVAALEQQLEGQPAKLTLRRSVMDEPGTAAGASNRPGASAIVESEVLNPLREIERELVDQRSRLAGARAVERSVRQDLDRMASQITGLTSRISADELEYERLRLDLESLRRNHGLLTDQYRATAIAIAAQAADLKIFEEPRTGAGPVAPRMRRNILYGGVGGLLAAVLMIGALAMLSATSPGKPGERAAERVLS